MTADGTAEKELIAAWTLPYAARLGSSVRSQGLYLEVRARLSKAVRKSLTVRAGELSLRMPEHAARAFAEAAAIVSRALEDIETWPVLPREIEDILGISTTERRRWLTDGRLPSCGTRTVKLRGRTKITFHVFDPCVVEDILDRGMVDAWRADDAEKAAEKRRHAAWKTRLTRPTSSPASPRSDGKDDPERFKLRGWAEFERDGLLR